MKKRKIISAFAFIVIMVLIITGCSKNDSMKSSENSTNSSAPQADYDKNEAGTDSYGYGEGNGGQLTNTSAVTSKEPNGATPDKIIRRVNMNVETQEFDNLITTIDQQIIQLGGYVESSEITGQRYYYSNDNRYGNIVARIPKKRLNEFINTIDQTSNVISKEESSENVTLQYIDVESHKTTLEIEQERLFALMEKTDTLENIITLESRLSDIRYELQRYASQLRTYDNQVEYSTVTLNIWEVQRISSIKDEAKQSVWDRIDTGFGDTMYNLSEGLKNFVVWFVVNLPYLIIWAGIITGVLLIVRKLTHKKKNKNDVAPRPVIEDKKDK